jgi:hypothetical protein
MVTLEELRQEFDISVVAPYGLCVIVPSEKFDSSWESDLKAQGRSCIFTEMSGKNVVLIKVGRRRGRPPKPKDRTAPKTDGKIVVAAPAGPEPPTPQPGPEVSQPKINVTIDVRVDWSNAAARHALRKFLEELPK